MFYSHTLLARKGPLGTVWCAAHAQHRLKKSQYTSTDIPKTVDLIMFPEAPLALRMSGHLLLGVVRIYSKKVDYLHHDLNLLNTLIRKAFLSIQVDLPEDARQAPVESVTLPQTLNLDEFDLEDDTLEREFNNHRLSEEVITLTDLIPTGTDPYVAVTFDEDIIPESIPMDVDQFTVQVSEHTERTDIDMAHGPVEKMRDAAHGLDPASHPTFAIEQQSVRVEGTESLDVTFDEDIIPEYIPMDVDQFTLPVSEHTERIDVDIVHEAGPDNEPRDCNISLDVGINSPLNLTEEQHPSPPEINRDAAHNLDPAFHPTIATEQQSDRIERTESSDDTLNQMESAIPNIGEEMLSSRRILASELRSGSVVIAGSEEARGNRADLSPQTANFALQPSPLPQPIRPRKRMRFDKMTVFTNRIMKERLEDPSDTLCKRKKMPSSKVGVWRMNNLSKKDQNFNEPLFTGFSDDLRNVYEKDYVASKPYLSVSDETLLEPAFVPSPTPESETEINPTTPISPSMAPDSTNLDTIVQVSPVQRTDDVQDIAGPRPANEEPVATQTQTPQTSASPPTRETETETDPTTPIPHSVAPDSTNLEGRVHVSPVQQTDDVQDIAGPQPAHAEPVATETETPQTLYTDVRVEHGRDGSHPVSTTPPPARSSLSKIDDFTAQPGTWDKTEPSASTIPEDQSEQRDWDLSPIPDMAEEVCSHELSFLEDRKTPDKSPASQDSDALSERARALAQYLNNRSSSSPTSSQPSRDLSLNEMLTGKTRKLAARMFFETLVLKSSGLIDMHQDQPYGDITLKLLPSLFSKVQT